MPKSDIVEQGYDLSINRYKEVVHAEVTEQQIVDLIAELRRLGRECAWTEFKCNNENLDEIAEYASALSNSAAIEGVEFAYLVWGIKDVTLDLVGTQFKPLDARKGNEPLVNWLIRSILPQIDLQFFQANVEGLPVVLLRIP